MIIALGDVYVRITERDAVREIMRRTATEARAQPGCGRYDFAEAVDEPGRFVVLAQWEDRASLERHYGSRTFADYQAAIAKHLVRTSDLRLHDADEGIAPVDSEPIEPVQED